MIINAGIREVVYHTAYSMNDVARDLLQQARVRVRQLQDG
jgi:deoxycytidylate deaminase